MLECELCEKTANLNSFELSPVEAGICNVCETCLDAISNTENLDYWRCLQNAVWSENKAVLIFCYRTLNRIEGQDWAKDLLDKLYLDEETQELAETMPTVHLDSNSAVLQNGDTITLIKDLNVKGASFTAKRGTLVKNIKLVENNPEQIEGKVNGTQIVILNQFVKKVEI